MGERKNPYKISVGEREGNRPLGRFSRRWGDSIRMGVKEMG
jgi:hypothetical protein